MSADFCSAEVSDVLSKLGLKSIAGCQVSQDDPRPPHQKEKPHS